METRSDCSMPLVVLRMPAVAATRDHLVTDREAMQALAGDGSAVEALCGTVFFPAPSAAWCGTLCEPCMERLHRPTEAEQRSGRHRLVIA